MEINERFYDAVLTEGARWLAILYKEKGPLVVHGWGESCFMDIARVATTYEIGVYFQMPWWRYLYMKYIKRFKFLKRPPRTDCYNIVPTDFIKELALYFKTTPEELARLCDQYGICR